MKRFLFATLFVFLAVDVFAQCATPAPAPGWVCLASGGWVPADHPLAAGTPAPAPGQPAPPVLNHVPPPQGAGNQWIIDAINAGQRLPEGVIYITPPLVLYDTPEVRGVISRTVFKPNTPATDYPLLVVMSNMPGEAETGYPRFLHLKDFRVECYHQGQIGIAIRGAAIMFERIVVGNCGVNVRFDWAVNVRFVDSRFVKAITSWTIPQTPLSATTVRCSGCSFSYNTEAVYTGGVAGLLFDQYTIFEYNAGRALHVGCESRGVMLRDVWLETNGTHVFDPCGKSRVEGATIVY